MKISLFFVASGFGDLLGLLGGQFFAFTADGFPGAALGNKFGEAIDPAGRVDEILFAGVERMAIRTDFNPQFFEG